MNPVGPGLADRLNLETGRIRWSELQRHFARGVVIVVSETLDLVDIAAAFIDDDDQRVKNLMEKGLVRRAETGDATTWNAGNSEFWAVVAAPWVLVQLTE